MVGRKSGRVNESIDRLGLDTILGVVDRGLILYMSNVQNCFVVGSFVFLLLF